jgi:hypothetical protein
MADPRRARGAAGEQAAAEMLAALGYQIVERNFRCRYISSAARAKSSVVRGS